MRNPLRRLFAASIWAPEAITVDEWKYRNLKRVLLPAIDLFFIFGGFSAVRFGIPAISEFFPDPVVDAFSFTLSLVAFACLVGVSFPRLWAVEIVAKILLLVQLVTYVTSLFLLTAVGEGNRGFVLFVSAVAAAVILWRITLLAAEWQERRLNAEVSE